MVGYHDPQVIKCMRSFLSFSFSDIHQNRGSIYLRGKGGGGGGRLMTSGLTVTVFTVHIIMCLVYDILEPLLQSMRVPYTVCCRNSNKAKQY